MGHFLRILNGGRPAEPYGDIYHGFDTVRIATISKR